MIFLDEEDEEILKEKEKKNNQDEEVKDNNEENENDLEDSTYHNYDRSKKTDNKKNTFVGTAEYVSPEVLVDQKAGPATDLWALGCIIFQMFTNTSPFKEKTEYLVFKKILENNYSFPTDKNVPEEAQDIIKSLLVMDPNKRLGSGSLGEEESGFKALKFHPFFTGLDFEFLNKIEPPFKIEFKNKKNKHDINNTNKITTKHEEIIPPKEEEIRIIKSEIIEKKSPWFHYNTRKVVLDNTPKIDYIDPEKNLVKVR